MKKILIILLLLPSFLNAENPFATGVYNSPKKFWATYYIDPSGNDVTGSGTILSPWKTLYKATSTVTSSGNLIYVKAGNYLETTQSILVPGVSITGDGNTSIIQATFNTYFTPIISATSAEGTNGNQSISFVKFDGRSEFTSMAVDFKGRSNVSVHDCTFIDFYECGVIMTGQDDNAPGAPSVYATGCTFYNNTMSNCAKGDGTFGRGCLMFGGMDGILIHDNVITNNSRSAGSNGWPIKGWDDSYIKNYKIYNNTLTTLQVPAGNYNGQGEFWDFAIELFDSYGGGEIYGNTMTGSIDMNRQNRTSAAYSVWIHDNIIGFPTTPVGRQSGIILEFDTYDAIIENNTIRNCADGIVFSMRGLSKLRNNTIRKNRIYNIGVIGGGYGTAIGNFDDGSASWTGDSIFVYNNTLVALSTSAYGIAFGNAATINKMDCKNNILVGFQYACVITNTPTAYSNSFFQYNCTYSNVYNSLFQNFAGTNVPSGATVSNNLISTDPSLGSLDTLNTGSVLIDAGTNVGLSYLGSAADIGYHEFGGGIIGGGGGGLPGTTLKVKGRLKKQ